MTTQKVANQLVKLCREGKYEAVYQSLFSPDVESIEPEGSTWGTVKGMDAILKKGQQWQELVEEVYSSEILDPIVADDFFACTMKTKIKMKGVSDPVMMDEICIYHVENGKVVSEQFFYTPMTQAV